MPLSASFLSLLLFAESSLLGCGETIAPPLIADLSLSFT